MARRKKEWFTDFRDFLQRNRSMLAYGMIILAVGGLITGWAMLPDMVTMFGAKEGEIPLYIPKIQALATNFGVSAVFTGVFWFRPRVLSYLICACIGLVMTFLILPLNLGYL